MPTHFGTTFLLAQGSGVQYEVMRKCHYVVSLQGFDVTLAAQDTTAPRYDLEQAEVYYFNDRVKIASKPNPSEFTIQILDYVQPDIVTEFWTWFKQIYDPATRNMGYASDYKRQGNLFLYDPNGQAVRTWTLSGLWPKNSPVTTDAYSYEAGQEVVKIEIALSCDAATLDGNAVST